MSVTAAASDGGAGGGFASGSGTGRTLPLAAHLVTPYLFSTGSWIHAQILHNPRYAAAVMTQGVENLDTFPFEPIHDLSVGRGPLGAAAFAFSKYLLGRFPAGPYRAICRREGVAVLHAHQGWEGARTVHLKRGLGVPFVTSFYGRDATVLPRKAYWRMLYRKLFREGDLFLAEGTHMAGTLAEIGAPTDRIRVIHLGVDLERIPFGERRPAADGKIVGLIAASFREKKGIPYALEAMARVAPRWPGLVLRIIGDGPMRSEIETRVSRSDLAGRVELLGSRDFGAYLNELRNAHFLMAPSVTAADGDTEGGAPVCLLDAQASGLPILATTHCDIPEATVPGKSALLSPERDVDGMAGHLEHLLAHPQEWPAMGRAGRAHTEAEYDIRRQGERMAAIYDALLRR
jgi:colanic acid/amylovoran biosynthesis glycosyltransferase